MGIIIENIGSEFKHHSYLILGNRKITLDDVLSDIGNIENISINGNPDISVFNVDNLLDKDAEEIKSRAYIRPIGDKKFIIVSFRNANRESQNALLKIVEEPPEGTYIILITEYVGNILPTLLSRLNIIDNSNQDNIGNEGRKFMQMSKADRIKFVSDIIENKDKDKAINLLNSIEKIMADDIIKNKSQLIEINKCRDYLADKSSSIKLILEHLALTID